MAYATSHSSCFCISSAGQGPEIADDPDTLRRFAHELLDQIGTVNVQRAGSVFLSSRAFAVPFLILMPPATVWFFGAVKRRTFTAWVEYAIIWLGLLLSMTRMTLIVWRCRSSSSFCCCVAGMGRGVLAVSFSIRIIGFVIRARLIAFARLNPELIARAV